jgi:hypothetical protein
VRVLFELEERLGTRILERLYNDVPRSEQEAPAEETQPARNAI